MTDQDSFSEIIRKIYTADLDAMKQTLELIDEIARWCWETNRK